MNSMVKIKQALDSIEASWEPFLARTHIDSMISDQPSFPLGRKDHLAQESLQQSIKLITI